MPLDAGGDGWGMLGHGPESGHQPCACKRPHTRAAHTSDVVVLADPLPGRARRSAHWHHNSPEWRVRSGGRGGGTTGKAAQAQGPVGSPPLTPTVQSGPMWDSPLGDTSAPFMPGHATATPATAAVANTRSMPFFLPRPAVFY